MLLSIVEICRIYQYFISSYAQPESFVRAENGIH